MNPFSFSTLTLKSLMIMVLCSQMLSCAKDDVSDLDAYVGELKGKFKGQVEALPVILPYDSYHYSVARQRDPFRPSVSLVKEATIKRNSNGIKPNEVRNKEGLEKYALQSLIMVGIMNNNGQNWAIVKAPDGTIFRVRKGNYMGENHGKIKSITESGIDLTEIVADARGGWIERSNKLNLTE